MMLQDPTFPPEVATKLEELRALLNIDPVLEFLARMEADAQRAPLARRFSETRLAWSSGVAPAGITPAFKELNELAYKRQQLLSDISSMKSHFLAAIVRAESVLLDLEAAKRDFASFAEEAA